MKHRSYAHHVLKFIECPVGGFTQVATSNHAQALMLHAKKHSIPAVMFKMNDGSGWGVLKLKKRLIHNCPACGYKRKTGEKYWKKAV